MPIGVKVVAHASMDEHASNDSVDIFSTALPKGMCLTVESEEEARQIIETLMDVFLLCSVDFKT